MSYCIESLDFRFRFGRRIKITSVSLCGTDCAVGGQRTKESLWGFRDFSFSVGGIVAGCKRNPLS